MTEVTEGAEKKPVAVPWRKSQGCQVLSLRQWISANVVSPSSPSSSQEREGKRVHHPPRREEERESWHVLWGVSDYEEQTWEWKGRATKVLQKAPILP